jgi:hypothetical protein
MRSDTETLKHNSLSSHSPTNPSKGNSANHNAHKTSYTTQGGNKRIPPILALNAVHEVYPSSIADSPSPSRRGMKTDGSKHVSSKHVNGRK